MFPIFSGRGERGIGMGYESFSKGFLDVCKQHIEQGIAKGFAFLFYEQGGTTDAALDREKGFDKLNEASGTDVTLFYLTDPDVTGTLFKRFNKTFMEALGIEKQTKPPCVVFFRVGGPASNPTIEDICFFKLDERMKDYMVVEQIRRHVRHAVNMWDSQGDLSALNPMPLLPFLGTMSKLAGG